MLRPRVDQSREAPRSNGENVSVDQKAALLQALRVTETDLDANRDGRLGANQRRRTLRHLAIGTVVGLGFSAWILAAALNGSRMPGVEAQNWIIPAVVGLVVAALTLVAVWTTLRGMRRRVECITSSLSLGLVRVGRGGSVAKLQVAGRAFTLPRPPHASAGVIPAYRAILTDGSYHVYVQGIRLVAMEPVSESLLDRAAEGSQGSVPVVGSATSNRQPRVTLFAKACIVFLLLGVLGMGVAGAYLMVVQFTGTAARATVTECVEDADARYPSVTFDCTGTWVTGGRSRWWRRPRRGRNRGRRGSHRCREDHRCQARGR